jgi:asparagine synthase (glutamine-hydrolysing)
MCGIAGIFNYHSNEVLSQEHLVKQMLSVIRHRGPDETGLYLGNNVGLGSVRLSIVDLSTGQQPMSDDSGNYWIVYNGEVFNYPELRTELEMKGIKFKTHSDTEVVVQMYAIYGADCLKYFNGQFAFCIWDKVKQELFLARDRVGIRPLFYWSKNETFAFCSEIKGLFTLEQVPKVLSPESLAQVFTLWTTLTPDTPFKDVFELPPAHYMIVKSGRIQIKRYWNMNFLSDQNQDTRSVSDSASEFEYLFKDAIRLRLRADVQVGAYLSGGLDSSLTTSYIHEIDPSILNTFSIGFKDKAFDETEFQMEVSKQFNTNHTAFECTSADISRYFADTIWHTEFPLLRTSPTPMYMLSRKVREQNIKVVITGEGADEIFAGYNIFKEAKIRRFWANEPNSTMRPRLLSGLYPYLPMMKNSNNMALKMFFGYKMNETNNPLYSHLLRWHNTSRITTYFSDEFTSSLKTYNPLERINNSLPEEFKYWSSLAQSQYLESTIFMSGYLLSSQGDRVAMGNSVEGRYPFLDYRVIEFASKLPDRHKLNCLNEKYILKRMGKRKIPDSILNRSKQAYRAPIASSFFSTSRPDNISEALSESCIKEFGIFDPKKVMTLQKKMETNNSNSEIDQMAIAGILSTQLLYKLFINQKITSDTESLCNVKVILETSI